MFKWSNSFDKEIGDTYPVKGLCTYTCTCFLMGRAIYSKEHVCSFGAGMYTCSPNKDLGEEWGTRVASLSQMYGYQHVKYMYNTFCVNHTQLYSL